NLLALKAEEPMCAHGGKRFTLMRAFGVLS
ncbi:hypothetical protein A2U01_0111774, partial [Trifolium medium]|nr:hypothetical protein [Trifolium medium]